LERADLFFSPGYNTPLFCPVPFVFTIHDLTHIFCRESRKPQIQFYYATVMKRACRRAARILTVSEFTRNQIISWSGASAEKVVSVGNGVGSAFQPEGDSYGFPFPYLLSVSNRKPHKNEFRIVEAFAKADLDPRIHLVFTGHATANLACWIEAQGVRPLVEFVGGIDEEKLPTLYRGAEALIFPSLYEGFGLPIVEAMACGTPVLTSNITAMPEIAGDAALLVDPTSVEQIARATEQIVNLSGLRQELRTKGLKRAARFSWARTTARAHDVIVASVRTCAEG
jgi:glycosyltransferase involved in cell wall biosynthesis